MSTSRAAPFTGRLITSSMKIRRNLVGSSRLGRPETLSNYWERAYIRHPIQNGGLVENTLELAIYSPYQGPYTFFGIWLANGGGDPVATLAGSLSRTWPQILSGIRLSGLGDIRFRWKVMDWFEGLKVSRRFLEGLRSKSQVLGKENKETTCNSAKYPRS